MIKLLFLAFLSFGLSHYAGGAQPLQAAAWTVIIAVIFAVLSLLLVKGRIIRLVSAVTFLAISYIGYYLGASESTTAFNSCVESSELIRQKVLDFRAQNNRFPENLHEVAILDCGQRIFRPSILNYHNTANGFELWFSDWLTKWTGSESEPMMARK